ncbi:MAG: hypothetical protein KDC54_18960 [Lewinella sp.]|nr:hypothetical protein [Lewinella sp.]
MIATHCTQCHTPLTDEHANVTLNMIQCPACKHVQPLLEALTAGADLSHKEDISHIEGIDVQEGLQLDVIIRPGLKRGGGLHLIMAAFCIGLPGFMSYTMVRAGQLNPVALLVLLVFVVVGGYLLITGIRRLTETTILTTDSRALTVRHLLFGQLEIKRRAFRRDQIRQFYVTQRVDSETNGRPNHAYALHLQLTDNTQHELINGFRRPEGAYFIERKIETYLDLEDKLVPGEYSPNPLKLPFEIPQNLQGLVKMARFFMNRK